MVKSSRLVLGFGILLGLSAAILPHCSFAATRITSSTENVTATINGYIAFSATDHKENTGVTVYDEQTNTYSGTFSLMDSTTNFGTTTYEVICNYLSDPNSDPNERLSGNCSNGWTVSAESSTATDNAATMVPSDQSITYRIKSTSPSTNPLNGTKANWLMKVIGVSKTVDTSTFTPSSTSYGYDDFNIIPAKNNSATVVTGNTFRTINSSTTYIGSESFRVQYGFTAGMDAVAGTYTGTVTYTLHLNAS